MCIACEMNFWSMIDALPPEARERVLRAQFEAERLACDAPPPSEGAPAPKASEDARKS